MNMDRVRFGIETTIAGFFWILPLVFILVAIAFPESCHLSCRHEHRFISRSNEVLQKEYLAYIAVVIVALSYLMGILADLFTHSLARVVFHNIMREKTEEERSVIDKSLITFLHMASSELIKEFNARRGRNMILRVVGFALVLNSIVSLVCFVFLQVYIWAALAISFALAMSGVAILKLFVKSYQKYDVFRMWAFELIKASESHQS